MEWFRLYHSIIDDPKIVRLSAEMRWYYVHMMCVACRQSVRGTLPDVDDIAIHLRVRPARAAEITRKLIDSGLIDEDVDTKALAIHGWASRQRQSDDVNARVKRYRNKSVTLHDEACNVTETLPRGRASEQNRDRDRAEQRERERTPAQAVAAPPEIIPIAPKADPEWEPQPLPDESMTGRAGRDQADFVRAVQILDGHHTTRRLGAELRMHCDTPGVRMLTGWQFVCGAFAVQRPDRNRTWGTLVGFARNATQAEFDKLNAQAPARASPGASLPRLTDEELRAQTEEGNRKLAEYRRRNQS